MPGALCVLSQKALRRPGEYSRNLEQYCMKGFLVFFGMSAGGWVGWAIGAQVSIFTAFIVSMVGTGIGLYYTRRAVKNLLP